MYTEVTLHTIILSIFLANLAPLYLRRVNNATRQQIQVKLGPDPGHDRLNEQDPSWSSNEQQRSHYENTV